MTDSERLVCEETKKGSGSRRVGRDFADRYDPFVFQRRRFARPNLPIFCHTEEVRSRPSWLYLVPWLVSFDGDGLAASAAAAVCANTAPFIIPKHAL